MLNLRLQNSHMHTVRAGNTRAGSVPNEWTPTNTAFLLKLVLYASVGVGAWLLLRSDTERGGLETKPEEPRSDDYSTWEPEQ